MINYTVTTGQLSVAAEYNDSALLMLAKTIKGV
jgi:hypothetical protein